MSRFDGVANEIIIRIMEVTSAGDIVSLASCCKHFSALAQDRLAFHRKKRAIAPDIVSGYHEDWDQNNRPSKHLQDILKNDDCRFYTKVMKIGSLDPYLESKSETKANSTLVAHVGTQYGHQLTALAANIHTALLPDIEGYDLEEWTKNIKDGQPETVILLLLTLYPNLETLEMRYPGATWSSGAWGELFYSLIEIASNPVSNTLGVFSKLSKFVWLGFRGDDGDATEMLYADLFMGLPTVRKILGRTVDAREVQWNSGTATSNTTHLVFRGDIDETSLSNLIRGCRALEYLSFQLETDEDWSMGVDRVNDLNSLKWGPQADNDIACVESKKAKSYGRVRDRDETNRPRWEPRGIVATLLQYASNSLISLNLTALGLEAVVPLSNDEPFVDSLRSFRALKVVFLDTMMLFRKTRSSSNVSSSRRKAQQQVSWKDMRPRPLVDFLPMTIEDFGMTSGFVGQGLSRGDVKEMFRGLPDGGNRLPKLQTIRVERKLQERSKEEKDGEQELSNRCDENDIEFYTRGPELETLDVDL